MQNCSIFFSSAVDVPSNQIFCKSAVVFLSKAASASKHPPLRPDLLAFDQMRTAISAEELIKKSSDQYTSRLNMAS